MLRKVLDYYEENEIIEVFPFLEPSGVSTSQMHSYQDILLQMNILNDCFYRVRNVYELLVIIDTDEVIVPVRENDKTWDDMLTNVDMTDEFTCSYQSQNVYYPETGAEFYSDIPKHNYMLQHVQRSVNFSSPGYSVKSFYVPDNIIVVHNHNALFSWRGEVTFSWTGVIPTEISQLSHYRDSVSGNFTETLLDTTIWKFKEELIRAVNRTLSAVNFDDN